MKDKLHQLRRRSIRWSSSSNDMPRDGFTSNSASRRRASATPSSSSWRTDGSDPSRCAARTALSVSGKSSASFSTSAMVDIGASLVSTASKARTHQKTLMPSGGYLWGHHLRLQEVEFFDTISSSQAIVLTLNSPRTVRLGCHKSRPIVKRTGVALISASSPIVCSRNSRPHRSVKPKSVEAILTNPECAM